MIIFVHIWVSHLNIPRYFKIFLLHNILLFILYLVFKEPLSFTDSKFHYLLLLTVIWSFIPFSVFYKLGFKDNEITNISL